MKPIPVFLALTLIAAPQLLAQPKSAAQSAVVPILDVKSGYLLGGSRGGKWISPTTAAKSLKAGASYRVFSTSRALGESVATAPKSQGAPCPDTLFSDIKPNYGSQAQFAVGGAHNPLPRLFRAERTDQKVYRDVVASILKRNGIAKPIVQIQQIWRVDLDGDGQQEVLLTAARKEDYGDPDRIASASRAGDYAILMLRRVVRGKVEDQIIEASYYPRAKEFNAPGFSQLAAVFDADGDGKMEVMVRGHYYEGDWTSLYSMSGTKARQVLVEGCGA